MALFIALAGVAPPESRDSRFHFLICWGVGTGGFPVSPTVRAVAVKSPLLFIWTGSVDVVVRYLLCCGGHDDPPRNGSRGVYDGARSCIWLRSYVFGWSDQGAAECAENLTHENPRPFWCLPFILDGGLQLPCHCPDLLDRKDEAQFSRGVVNPRLLL